MFRTNSFAVICFLLACQTVSAATVIDVIGENGQPAEMIVDGDRARIELGGQMGYVLVDNSRNAMFAVVPDQKHIIDMSGNTSSMEGRQPGQVKVNLVASSPGPLIAGYTTGKYLLTANDKHCGVVFASKEAMTISGLPMLFDSIKTMVNKQRAAMGSYAAFMDVCTRANMEIASRTDTIGVPMLVLNSKGKPLSKIKSINANVTVPTSAFILPDEYTRSSVTGQLNMAERSTTNKQNERLDTREMMKQMRRSGRMSPQTLERMKHYQERMQR